MVNVRVIKDGWRHAGRAVEVGEVITVPEPVGGELVGRGLAEHTAPRRRAVVPGDIQPVPGFGASQRVKRNGAEFV